jgi:hypothetical protein
MARVTRRGRIVAAVALLGIAGAGVWWALDTGVGPLPDPERCIASTEDHSVVLSIEQAENASIIAGIGQQRGLPARAVSIALATAFQESKLTNIKHGDRDSVGLFQQRPSQGWGSVDEILDPIYATNAFYDALVEVEGYQDMPITEAAQAVQRSAYPDAYADHEEDARTIASALTGWTPAGFSCIIDAHDEPAEQMRANGLTPRANAVLRSVTDTFGPLPTGGYQPGGVSDGHMEGSAHYDGRAIDFFFRPVNDDNRRRGWALAHYLVANADALAINHVIFDGRIWTAGSRSEDGWRSYTPPQLTGNESAETRAVLEHRDHVHMDVD